MLFHELSAWQQYRAQMLAIIAALIGAGRADRLAALTSIGAVYIAEVLARSSMTDFDAHEPRSNSGRVFGLHRSRSQSAADGNCDKGWRWPTMARREQSRT